MNIGQVAKLSHLNSKTIRYYEAVGLVIPRRNPDNQYRDYSEEMVQQLCFLRQARKVGFNLAQCRELLELYRNPRRRSAEVKRLVTAHIDQLEQQLETLTSMRDTLAEMAQACPGNEQAQCAIIDSLTNGAGNGPQDPG